jgi:hypothetical protein
MLRWLQNNIVTHIRALPRKLGILWVWEHVVADGVHAFRKLGLLGVFVLLAAGTGFWAYHLQRVAFPPAGSSAEPISATVYVQELPAQVILQSTFTPGAPINNVSFTVNVIGPTKAPDPWLLVVQCSVPPGKSDPYSIPLYSESSESTANPPKMASVRVVPGPTKRHHQFNFTCYTGLTEQGQTTETVVQNRDLNLSLPVLEQNPDTQSALPDAPLYAEKVAGKIEQLVEVQALPGAPCPASTPGLGSASLSAGSAGSSSGTPSPSPTATSSPSPSAKTSPTPSPSAAACYTKVSPDATSVRYSFPPTTTVATSETLNNVKLSDERIDSMYPQGMITTDQVTWNGGAGLSPSLSATNLDSAQTQNKDEFYAGLLWGIAAALAIPYFVEFYRVWHEERHPPVKGNAQQGPE